jgi:hypothetical protein
MSAGPIQAATGSPIQKAFLTRCGRHKVPTSTKAPVANSSLAPALCERDVTTTRGSAAVAAPVQPKRLRTASRIGQASTTR